MDKLKTGREQFDLFVGIRTHLVEALEAEPGKRWRFVVEKAIYVVVSAIVGFALVRLGMG